MTMMTKTVTCFMALLLFVGQVRTRRFSTELLLTVNESHYTQMVHSDVHEVNYSHSTQLAHSAVHEVQRLPHGRGKGKGRPSGTAPVNPQANGHFGEGPRAKIMITSSGLNEELGQVWAAMMKDMGASDGCTGMCGFGSKPKSRLKAVVITDANPQSQRAMAFDEENMKHYTPGWLDVRRVNLYAQTLNDRVVDSAAIAQALITSSAVWVFGGNTNYLQAGFSWAATFRWNQAGESLLDTFTSKVLSGQMVYGARSAGGIMAGVDTKINRDPSTWMQFLGVAGEASYVGLGLVHCILRPHYAPQFFDEGLLKQLAREKGATILKIQEGAGYYWFKTKEPTFLAGRDADHRREYAPVLPY